MSTRRKDTEISIKMLGGQTRDEKNERGERGGVKRASGESIRGYLIAMLSNEKLSGHWHVSKPLCKCLIVVVCSHIFNNIIVNRLRVEGREILQINCTNFVIEEKPLAFPCLFSFCLFFFFFLVEKKSTQTERHNGYC